MFTRVSRRQLTLEALLEGEAYALQIVERIKATQPARGMRWWPELYPILRSLKEDGLVSGRIGETSPPRDGRPRYYYALTESGRLQAQGRQRDVCPVCTDVDCNHWDAPQLKRFWSLAIAVAIGAAFYFIKQLG